MSFRNRRGFALPLALFFIGLMTVTIAASFTMASSERRSSDAQAAQRRAYNAASIGLETYVGGRASVLGLTGQPAANEPEQVFSINGSPLDSAYVMARLVRAESGTPGQPTYIPAMYAVRSRGVYRGDRTPGVGNAERTVGMLAIYERGNLQILAGWTSLSGLRKNGSSGLLSGVDRCGSAATVAGVAVPDGQFSGNDDAMQGNPPIRYLGTQAAANAAVQINWRDIQSGTAIPADFEDRWPTAAQYDNPSFWPVIHIRASQVDLPRIHASQRGLLIIDGNLSIGGGVTWDGIILVGGNLTSNGNNTVYGAVVTGLDERIGEDVISSDVGNGTKIYQYDSCNVNSATASMGVFRPVRNTFVDNWKAF